MLVCLQPKFPIDQWFPSRGLWGWFGNIWRHVWLSRLKRCGWRPGCSTFYSAQDGHTTKDSLAPMSAVPKLRSPDVEKTQGSQATAASHEWVKGKKPHSVHGVLLLLLHRWSFGSNLEATRTACCPWGESRPSTGYRNLQWMSATVVGKSRP